MTHQGLHARLVEFHGHMCPGLAMGMRAAELGLRELAAGVDDEIVTIVETDMCGVDAIQVLTGCTFGRGNLIHHDHGKSAFTFIRRSDGRAVRVGLRPGGWGQDDDGWLDLVFKMQEGTATRDERRRAAELQQARSEWMLDRPAEDIFEIRDAHVEVPPPARLRPSVECEQCGEPTMETRIHYSAGRALCPPCAGRSGPGRAPDPHRAPPQGPCGCGEIASRL